jgi:hypothetical protein
MARGSSYRIFFFSFFYSMFVLYKKEFRKYFKAKSFQGFLFFCKYSVIFEYVFNCLMNLWIININL